MLQLMTRKCWARLPEMASSSCSDNPAVKHACLLSVCPHLIPYHHTRIVLAIQRTSAIRNSTSFLFLSIIHLFSYVRGFNFCLVNARCDECLRVKFVISVA